MRYSYSGFPAYSTCSILLPLRSIGFGKSTWSFPNVLSRGPNIFNFFRTKGSLDATFQETGANLGYPLDCGLGGNLGYTEHMKKGAVQPAGEAGKGQSYVPGSQGRFITNRELTDWWHSCKCVEQSPTLEMGDRWFIDPPMMWEACGETILTKTLHVLPPQLWRHLN